MSEPSRLICGMTPATARRYLTVRQELDIIINQLNEAADRLGSLGCHDAGLIGRIIGHCAAVIRDYLDNEFVSPEKIVEAMNHRRPENGRHP